MRRMRKKDRECECVERCESAGREKQRVALIICVCEQQVMALKYEEKFLANG